jgi:long-chain acyl-CoA synthetase
MSQEYFGAYLGPKPGDWSGRMNMRAQFLAAVALFNAYPLPHSMGNIRDSLGYTADLVDAGYCPLVYPEGERSPDGRLQPFRPGIGRMSVRLGVPVVPVHLAGMFAILPPHESWPRSGPAAVTIGPPVYPRRAAAREDPEAEARQITREVEQRIGRMDSEVRD